MTNILTADIATVYDYNGVTVAQTYYNAYITDVLHHLRTADGDARLLALILRDAPSCVESSLCAELTRVVGGTWCALRPRWSGGCVLHRPGGGRLVRHLGRKADVQANPHKFRYTGATQFLKNGGDAFTLKEILGHTTMEMVDRYVHLAQVDIDEAHRRASPVYNWDLRT